ncbi:MAG: hypothetical protein MJ197_08840 [Bacteroidales bacterium]|nr:hypothetical protein [Bacteroidales bacterium]
MADNRTFLEIEIDTKKAQQEVAKLREQAKQLDEEFNSLTEEEKQSEKAQDDYNRKIKVLQDSMDKYTKILKDNKVEMQANRREVYSAQGSYNQLSATYTRLKNELNELDPKTDEWKKLSKQAKEVYNEMNNLQKATGKYTLQVGSYEIATRGLINAFKQEYEATGSVKSGLAAVGKEMKLLIANPLGVAITTIVVAFQAFKNILNSTEEGQMKWAKATGTITGALSGLKEILVQVGPLLADLFSGNWSALKNDWNNVKDAWGNVLNVARETGNISAERVKLIREEAETKKKVAEYESMIVKQEGIARDTSKTKEQRERAVAEIKKLTILRYDEEIKLAQKKLDLQKKEDSLTSNTVEDNAKLIELETDLVNIQTSKQQYLNSLLKVENSIAKIKGDEAEKEKDITKELEKQRKLLEDAASAETSLYEYLSPDERDRRIQEEEKAFQKAREDIGKMQLEDASEINALLEDVERKHAQNLIAIEAEIQAEKDKNAQKEIDNAKKVADEELKQQQKKLNNNAQYTSDMIGSIVELSSVNSAESKKSFELNKKLQYAQTSMEGIRAGIKVFTSEGSFYEHLAQAAAIAISTGASLAKISNTSFSSASSSPTVQNTTQSVNNSILQRYNTQELSNRPQTVLVIDEVTAKQQQISNSQKLAIV